MKLTKISIGLMAIAGLAAFSFTAPKADLTLKVDPAKSKIKWIGKKVTGSHEGAINVTSGSLVTDGKVVKGGTFDIDMTSITCTDLTDKEYNGKLIGHLKSEDFFNTAKFGTSTFVITTVIPKGGSNVEITGKLTIKGITKDLTFPAVVTIGSGSLTASAKIVIDRTKYDIKYGSSSFFDSLGDKAIHNDFTLEVSLVANK